jgi:uncharacterized protein
MHKIFGKAGSVRQPFTAAGRVRHRGCRSFPVMSRQSPDSNGRRASRPLLIVSVHDVATASLEACQAWADLLEPLAIPLTLLAIPGPWRGSSLDEPEPGDGTGTWLRGRQERGDEVAVHGWTHTADAVTRHHRRAIGRGFPRGTAEFSALDRATSEERTRRGLDVLARHGLHVTGTTPPGWLASPDAVRGFADAGLHYATDPTGVLDLRTGRHWRAPVVCHRPAHRRATRRDVTEDLGRRLLDTARRSSALGRSLRIGLHPDDIDRPGLASAVVRTVERSLEAGALAIAYRDVATFSGTGKA